MEAGNFELGVSPVLATPPIPPAHLIENVSPHKLKETYQRFTSASTKCTEATTTTSGDSHRSPCHVRFGTCNLRSDTFLRHLLTSPYYKSPNSVSSCRDSPLLFKTPNRETSSSTPSSSNSKTPSTSRLHPGVCNHVTPQGNIMKNPFDMDHDRINFPDFSPGLFTILSTPSGEDGTFQWSIEHIAELNPAHIDEMPLQSNHFMDKEAEERAQAAISRFFASGLIVPSPWNAPARNYVTPCTPQSAARPTQMFPEDLQGSIQKELSKLRKSQDASCQTMLSFPVDFDVQAVLGDHMNCEQVDDSNQEVLSTSSLRRKLFFQGDNSTALSPVKGEIKLLEDSTSPLCQTTPELDKPWNNAASGNFSSSPIKEAAKKKPLFQRSPVECDYLASPDLFPVNAKLRVQRTKGSTLRSSDCGLPNKAKFTFDLGESGFSPVCMDRGDSPAVSDGNVFSPFAVPDMSPIGVPRTRCVDLQLSPLPMPNLSPIACSRSSRSRKSRVTSLSNMSPIRAVSISADNDLGASYLQDDGSHDLSNLSSPQDKGRQLGGAPPNAESTAIEVQPHTFHFRESTAMDIETCSQDAFRYQGVTNTFSAVKDMSVDDIDTTSDFLPLPCSTTQDTGYQTNSLVLTGQDTGLHTNLTSQFSSMPFKADISNRCSEEFDDGVARKMGPRVCLHYQWNSDDNDDDNPERDILGLADDNDVLERARQALAFANSKCPPQTSDMDSGINQSDSFQSDPSSVPAEPIGSSTPTKRTVRRIERKIAVIPSKETFLASDMAEEVLKRAEHDLLKYSVEKNILAS